MRKRVANDAVFVGFASFIPLVNRSAGFVSELNAMIVVTAAAMSLRRRGVLLVSVARMPMAHDVVQPQR